MKQLLTNFSSEYKRLLLDFLWLQWSTLGVAGHARSGNNFIADPEALLLLTCSVGRHDARLFDEVLDWLQTNGWLVNVMRLKRILSTEKFTGGQALAAIAGLQAKGAETAKWKLLANSVKPLPGKEPLIYGEAGKTISLLGEGDPVFSRYGFQRGPVRLRGYSREFRPTEPASLILQLRALLGISVRCEIVSYLLTHDAAHPSEIAREAHYFPRSVQGALADMSRSGVIQVRAFKREKRYWLNQKEWLKLLNRADEPTLRWINWPPLLRALEQIAQAIDNPALQKMDPLLQSSELRELMRTVRPALERAGYDRLLSDDRQYLGESYLPVFIADVKKLLS